MRRSSARAPTSAASTRQRVGAKAACAHWTRSQSGRRSTKRLGARSAPTWCCAARRQPPSPTRRNAVDRREALTFARLALPATLRAGLGSHHRSRRRVSNPAATLQHRQCICHASRRRICGTAPAAMARCKSRCWRGRRQVTGHGRPRRQTHSHAGGIDRFIERKRNGEAGRRATARCDIAVGCRSCQSLGFMRRLAPMKSHSPRSWETRSGSFARALQWFTTRCATRAA